LLYHQSDQYTDTGDTKPYNLNQHKL